MQYPAKYVVHWPSGPTNACDEHACDEHAAQLVHLGNFMGAHIACTEAAPGAQCQNCVNEAKENSDGRD